MPVYFDEFFLSVVKHRERPLPKQVLLGGSVAVTEVEHDGQIHRCLVLNIDGCFQVAVAWDTVRQADKLASKG